MRRIFACAAMFLATMSLHADNVSRPASLGSRGKPLVRIGVILPLSGENAQIGAECRVGLKILEEELKAKDTAFEYEFVIEDDQLQPKLTAQAVQKLLRVDKVDALVPTYSSGGNIAKPFCQAKEVPMIANAASDATIPDSKTCFTFAPDPDKEAAFYVKTLKALGVRRLGLLSVQQQGALALRAGVLKYAAAEGVEVVADERFLFGERDFRTLWLKIREKKPEAVLLQALDPEFPLIWRHKKQMGVEVPVSTIEWFSCTGLLPELEGAWQVGSAISVFENGFARRASEIDPKIKVYLNASYTHDSVGVLVDAYESWAKENHPAVLKRARPTGPEVAQRLRKTAYAGACGKLSLVGKGVIDQPIGLNIIRNGTLQVVSLEELVKGCKK